MFALSRSSWWRYSNHKPANSRFVLWLAIAFWLFAWIDDVAAFEQLTAAQKLVYDTAHLANTNAGQQIKYRYQSQSKGGDTISDRVRLTINKKHDDDRRDVVLDFLSDERHMNLPDFSGYRGNPVIIAMLEHIAQGMGRETGGGALYFRNRIRDGLARIDSRIERLEVNIDERSVGAIRLNFTPFVGDPYLAEQPIYTNARFSIVLSEEVPGGVVAIAVRSAADNATLFLKELVLD